MTIRALRIRIYEIAFKSSLRSKLIKLEKVTERKLKEGHNKDKSRNEWSRGHKQNQNLTLCKEQQNW